MPAHHTTAHIGDLLELAPGVFGCVVCSLDAREWSDDYPERDWAWLGGGLLVRTTRDELVHLPRAPAPALF